MIKFNKSWNSKWGFSHNGLAKWGALKLELWPHDKAIFAHNPHFIAKLLIRRECLATADPPSGAQCLWGVCAHSSHMEGLEQLHTWLPTQHSSYELRENAWRNWDYTHGALSKTSCQKIISIAEGLMAQIFPHVWWVVFCVAKTPAMTASYQCQYQQVHCLPLLRKSFWPSEQTDLVSPRRQGSCAPVLTAGGCSHR